MEEEEFSSVKEQTLGQMVLEVGGEFYDFGKKSLGFTRHEGGADWETELNTFCISSNFKINQRSHKNVLIAWSPFA